MYRCTLTFMMLSLLFSFSGLNAQTPGKKAPKAAPAAPPPPPPPASAAAPTETSFPTARHSSNDSLDFSEGRYGFSYGFPDGGSPFGAGFVGARYFVAPDRSIGAYLLLGDDSSAKTNSFGLAGKYTSYFAKKDRVHLFYFAQLSLGKNGGAANKGKDDTLFGFGGGAGLEYALLKDFSVSAEGGFGYNTLPDSKSAYATGTGKLAVNFYY